MRRRYRSLTLTQRPPTWKFSSLVERSPNSSRRSMRPSRVVSSALRAPKEVGRHRSSTFWPLEPASRHRRRRVGALRGRHRATPY
eukprot:4627425-Prymnesium_polylepis.1